MRDLTGSEGQGIFQHVLAAITKCWNAGRTMLRTTLITKSRTATKHPSRAAHIAYRSG